MTSYMQPYGDNTSVLHSIIKTISGYDLSYRTILIIDAFLGAIVAIGIIFLILVTIVVFDEKHKYKKYFPGFTKSLYN